MNINLTSGEKTSEKIKKIERAIVTSILFDERVKEYAIENEINERFIQSKGYKRVLKTFNKLANGSVPITLSVIKQQIYSELKNETEQEHWENWFQTLNNEHIESVETLVTYIEILKKSYKVKRYSEFCDNLENLVKTEKISPLSSDFGDMEKKIDHYYSQIMEEFTDKTKKSMDFSEGFQYTIEKMKEAKESNVKEYVSTGYDELDKIYNGGLLKGTYSIIAARPAMGKTVTMLNQAVEGAKRGERTLFISIEMNLLQCFQRLIAKLADIDSGKLQLPELMTEEDWAKLRAAGKKLFSVFHKKFWIIEVTELSVNQLRRIIQEYKKKYDIDIAYVDYAQIMSTEQGGKPDTEGDYAGISEGLRKVSKSENVHISVGSQLNRKVEDRSDKRPLMSDLRNSGAFEQDAAYISGLYRDEVYNENSEKANILEYIILKHRFGDSNKAVEFAYNIKKQSIFSKVS